LSLLELFFTSLQLFLTTQSQRAPSTPLDYRIVFEIALVIKKKITFLVFVKL